MRKFSAFLVATALTVAPAGLAFAADTDAKATQENNMTGRGQVDPTGKPMGANPIGPAATQGARVNSGAGTGIGRGNVDPTGKAQGGNVLGNASVGGAANSGIGRGQIDPTGKPMGANVGARAETRSSAATMQGSDAKAMTRTGSTATVKTNGRHTRAQINAYEQAKVTALNMPQNTQAERDARSAAILRADSMIR